MAKISFILTTLWAIAVGANANPCEGRDNNYFSDNPESCRDYFVCHDGESYPQKCPEGYSFDEALQLCWYWDKVECGDLLDPCYGKPHFSFVERPTGTCASYYRCEYNVGVPLDCQEGFFFDEANQMCNFPDQVDCVDNPEKPTPPNPCSQGASIRRKSEATVFLILFWYLLTYTYLIPK